MFLKIAAGTTILRLYNPYLYKAQALAFRTPGPISRFDHQRAPYPSCADDPERGIIYGAYTLSSCIVEVFGDSKVIEVGTWEVAVLNTTKLLTLLDLRGPGAMRAGTVSAVSKESNRQFSQEWSRYFYDNGFIYTNIDGLAFYNAHNDEEAFAFYERADGNFQCSRRSPTATSRFTENRDPRNRQPTNDPTSRAILSLKSHRRLICFKSSLRAHHNIISPVEWFEF